MASNAVSNPKRRGRPSTGLTRSKISVSIPINLLAEAKKRCGKTNESLSQYVARALQTALMQ